MGFSLSKPFKSVVKSISKVTSSVFGDELGSALTMAGLAALAVYSGGAALGGLGITAGGAAAGGAAALGSTGGAVATAAGAMSGYQQGAAKVDAQKQEAAQQEAQNKALEAQREQELYRKRAMLAEQHGLDARYNAARNVRNNLQGLASNKLGSGKEQLGG